MSSVDPKRLSELHAAGRELGLLDLDLCLLVGEGVPAREGLRQLRRQYPKQFKPDARTMAPDVYKAAEADLLGESHDVRVEQFRERVAAEMAKPSVRDLPEREFQQRVAEMLKAIR